MHKIYAVIYVFLP